MIDALTAILDASLEQIALNLEGHTDIHSKGRAEYRRYCRLIQWVKSGGEDLQVALLSMEQPPSDNNRTSKVRVVLEVSR